MEPNEAPVLVTRRGYVTHILLNRPRAINALTTEMISLISDAITAACNDDSTAIVISGAGDRGLCGGGDIKEMAADGAKHGTDFIAREYELDLLTYTSETPIVGLMDGITMGGGIGLTAHGDIRLVTERSRLAMPETRIGIVPDVGGHLLLARAPGRIGEYLAVTSGSMTAADAIAFGFADQMIQSDQQADLVNALAERAYNRQAVDAIVHEFTADAGPSPLQERQAQIDALFTAALQPVYPRMTEDPLALATWALESAKELERIAPEHDGDVAQALAEVSPTSVVVTLAQLHRTRALGLTLEQVLQDDLRVLSRLFMKDFSEGVRARVIDKDNAPRWEPNSFAAVRAEEIASILDPTSA